MTLEESIRLNDGMTAVIYRIHRAARATVHTFEQMGRAAGRAIPASAFGAARQEIDRVGEAIRRAREQQELLNDSVEQLAPAWRRAALWQGEYSKSMQPAESVAEGLLQRLGRLAKAVAGSRALKGAIHLSDDMAMSAARLNLVNDGLRTTDQLQQMIFQAAQRSRTGYLEMAEAVVQLRLRAGDVFTDNGEAAAFAEQMNKQFALAGAGPEETREAALQLTQALGDGALRGDGYDAMQGAAPNILRAIADYTGVDDSQMRQLAEEGRITANIVKNALLAAAEETNAAFASMPYTFTQVWTNVKNTLLQTFEPLIQALGAGAQFIMDHWSVLEPVFWGLAAALGIFTGALVAHKVATWLAADANRAFMASLLHNPLTWIAVGLAVVAGAVYRWVQSVGGAKIAWTKFCYSLHNGWEWTKYMFLYGVDAVASLLEKLAFRFLVFKVEAGNALRDFAILGLRQFRDFINGTVGMWNSLAASLNKGLGFFGIQLPEAREVDDIIFQLEANKLWDNTQLMMEGARLNANAAAREISLNERLYGIRATKAEQEAKIARMQAELNSDPEPGPPPEPDMPPEPLPFEGFANDMADTAYNTGRMADQMEITEEDLKYLRDIAEREAVNRFTTAEIKLDMTNYNTVNGERDLDGMVDYIGEKLLEQMAAAAEGVHI